MKILNTTLIEHIFDYDVVLVPMGPYNSFNRGFPSWLKVCFPNLRAQECKLSPYGNRKKIGTILPIKEGNIIFCMCYIHNGGFNQKHDGSVYVSYDAIESCLSAVASKYKNKRIATIVMGIEREDGNGDKEHVMSLYEKYFENMDNVDVYDAKHWDFVWIMCNERKYHYRRYRRKEIDKPTLRYELKKVNWKIKHGIFEPMPDDYKITRGSMSEVIRVKKSDLEKNKKK